MEKNVVLNQIRRLQRRTSRILRAIVPALDRHLLQHDITTELQRALEFQEGLFPEHIMLPLNFGKALPERALELLLATLSYQPGLKVLDVGYAHAMKCHLDMIQSLATPKFFTGLDIAPASYNATPYYCKTLAANIADEPLSTERFDLVWCISTLEHIGMDNSNYQKHFKREQMADFSAVKNMLRLLARNGRLLITVPYGKAEDHGWLRNYDRDRWQAILQLARDAAILKEWYFRHTYGAGWVLCSADELAHVGYYDQHNSGAGGMAAVLIEQSSIHYR
jgi:O-antigen chain-terminating methyltransferase